MLWFVKNIIRPRWIMHPGTGELGIRIFGVNVYYYKRKEPIFLVGSWRYVQEKEFGNSIHPIPRDRYVHPTNAR